MIDVLGLNEPPVDDSLFDFFYVHGASSFLQDDLRGRKDRKPVKQPKRNNKGFSN